MFGFSFIPAPDIFELVLFMVEYMPYIIAVNIGLAFIAKPVFRPAIIGLIPLTLLVMIFGVFTASWEDASMRGYDFAEPSLRQAIENYIESGNGTINEIFESGDYAPTFGKHEMKYLLTDLASHTLLHLDSHNILNIPVGYNKGNDWFRATLGDPMVYTSGIFKDGETTLASAQKYKLDYVAHAIDLKKGDKVLDIGCGWGRLVKYFTEAYEAEVTGITLSKEQIKYGLALNKDNNGRIELQDGMKMHERKDLIPPGGYDAITALEMAEHVGIRRYDEFLRSVHGLLKDDGVFYIQVAGLRRKWQFEDLVWGLYMGEHVFPGADASCNMGWVTQHLERAGFEVQRVSNLGIHYSKTLTCWLEEWYLAKDTIIAKYGETAFRRWEVFLSWSIRIARQGSSTVFMITATKQGQEAARTKIQQHLAPDVQSHESIFL